VLLQILDDGRLTDSQGRTVDFKNTLIIMTSNIGSPHLLENASESGEIAEDVRKKVMNELRGHFRPEFLNRVDEIVLFKPLTLAEIKRIVELQLTLLRTRLADRHIELELSDAAKEHIAREGYDPVYGARPLKRFLQRQVETALSRKLLAGDITDHSRVTVELKEGELVFSATQLKKAADKEETP
jgi:ATP-dependent Clp protease ATP-binding subunit ClpB